MSLAASGIVASIVPFDPTYGIAVVASVMLAVFVIGMVGFAVAPLVSDSWASPSTTATSATAEVEPSDD